MRGVLGTSPPFGLSEVESQDRVSALRLRSVKPFDFAQSERTWEVLQR